MHTSSKNTLAKDKLIVALDVPTRREARELVSSLSDVTGMFKIGSQLFTSAGPEFVREIISAGARVFLDLKFHDIPNTVAQAGIEATRLGVSIFNVHGLGGAEMMRRTADAVSEVAEAERLARPALIAVTVLTSTDNIMLRELGISSSLDDQVRRLTLLAEASGMDGVVSSAWEISLVRSVVRKRDFIVVTPGVRPAKALPYKQQFDDQKRVMTPSEAVQSGADYLVVGRPIIAAKDPVDAASLILAEMEAGLA
jgi:orotidine-5'-phosphate decarboxylase